MPSRDGEAVRSLKANKGVQMSTLNYQFLAYSDTGSPHIIPNKNQYNTIQ